MPDELPPRVDEELTHVTLRVRAGNLSPTDPFDFALIVVGDEGVATLKALKADLRLTTAHRKAIFAKLRALGFHTVVWHRHEPGSDKRRTMTYDLVKGG